MITGNLEYLMSSLPYLSFQDTQEERSRIFSLFKKYAGPLETETEITTILDKEAGKFLSPKAFYLLQKIRLQDIHEEFFQKSGNAVLASFSTYMYRLKKDLVALRNSRKKGSDVSSASKQNLPLIPGNPLEEEKQLIQWQWAKLEALSLGHYADFTALILYKLQLLVLLRWWGFDQEKGFERFLNSTT